MREQLNNALDVLQGAARYRWPAILAAWVLCLVGWAFVMLLPNKYEARSRVFVDTSTALSPVIQGLAIQQDVTAQLNLMQQTLVGDAQLDRVIDETNLIAAAVTDQDRAEIKDKLRDSIDVTMDIASSRGPKGSRVLVELSRYRPGTQPPGRPDAARQPGQGHAGRKHGRRRDRAGVPGGPDPGV